MAHKKKSNGMVKLVAALALLSIILGLISTALLFIGSNYVARQDREYSPEELQQMIENLELQEGNNSGAISIEETGTGTSE